MHPHTPLSPAAHCARYPAAVVPLYRITADIYPWGIHGPPAFHVFDRDDGLRLLITREDHNLATGQPPEIILHVSASCCPDTPMGTDATINRPCSPGMRDAAREFFHAITGVWLQEQDFEFSFAGYPHWYVPQE